MSRTEKLTLILFIWGTAMATSLAAIGATEPPGVYFLWAFQAFAGIMGGIFVSIKKT